VGDEPAGESYPEHISDDLDSGLVYPSEVIWLEGIHLTPYHCPDCLRSEDFDCDTCTFYSPEDCRLLTDVDYRNELIILFSITRQRNIDYARRQRELKRVVYLELKAHGRPLHYSVIADVVSARHPSVRATARAVAIALAKNPHLFTNVSPGVYGHRLRGGDSVD
jgi:hypothetical protein